MVDWQVSTHPVNNQIIICIICRIYRICKICLICRIWRICKPGLLWPLPVYSSSAETKTHGHRSWFQSWTAEAICRTRYYRFGAEKFRRRFQAGGWTPSPGVCCNFFGVIGQQEMRIWPGCFTCPIRRVVYRLMCPHVVLDFCRHSVSNSALFCTTNY